MDIDLVANSISAINLDFYNNLKNDKGIINLSPLKEDKSFEDVRKSLNRYIKVDNKSKKPLLIIDDFTEDLEEFRDRITFFELNDQHEIISRIFLPSDKEDIKMFFNDEFKNCFRVNEINTILKNLLDIEEFYKLNDIILDQIYPSSIPRAMTFVTNKEIRIDLWRDVLKNLPEYYDEYMPQAFMNVLDNSDFYEISDIGLSGLRIIIKMITS